MARKNGSRADPSDICVFDSRTKAVMAQHAHDGVREKVASVREVITDRGKDQVIQALQYYDYDVERTIQAFLEDGATEALQEWHYYGNKPPSKKKKKPKKKKDQREAGPGELPSAPSGEQTPHHEVAAAGVTSRPDGDDKDLDARVGDSLDEDPSAVRDNNKTPAPLPQRNRTSRASNSQSRTTNTTASSSGQSPHSHALPQRTKRDSDSRDARTKRDSESRTKRDSEPRDARTKRDNESRTSQSAEKATNDRPAQTSSHGTSGRTVRPNTLLNTVSTENRPRTMSESSTKSGTSEQSKKSHGGLQKSLKDLQRQTTSLQRLKMMLTENIDKSYLGIKNSFEQLQTELNNREVELITEMDKVKKDALDTLSMRQKKAADLKLRTDRQMNEHELLELRADIKQFVTDRKLDEELCETTRFVCELKALLQQMQAFGEVVAVKPCYSTRRPSLSSIASSHDDFQSPFPSVPTTPLLTAPPVAVTSTNFRVTDSSLTPRELAELQSRLQDSLKQQGVTIRSPPPRHAPNPHTKGQGSAGKGHTESAAANASQDDAKKGRSARRRQRIREREREGNGDNQNDGRIQNDARRQPDHLNDTRRQNEQRNVRRTPSPLKSQGYHGNNENRPPRQNSNNRRGTDSNTKGRVNGDLNSSSQRGEAGVNGNSYKRLSPEKSSPHRHHRQDKRNQSNKDTSSNSPSEGLLVQNKIASNFPSPSSPLLSSKSNHQKTTDDRPSQNGIDVGAGGDAGVAATMLELTENPVTEPKEDKMSIMKKQHNGGSTGPEQQNGGSTGPEHHNGGSTGPEHHNGGNTGPEHHNGGSTGPEHHNGGSTGPEHHNGGSTGPEHHNGGSTGPEHHNGGSTGPEQQKGGSTGPEQQNGGSTGPEHHNGGSTGPEQQNGSSKGSKQHIDGSGDSKRHNDGSVGLENGDAPVIVNGVGEDSH